MGLKRIKDIDAVQTKKDKYAKKDKTIEERIETLEKAAGLR